MASMEAGAGIVYSKFVPEYENYEASAKIRIKSHPFHIRSLAELISMPMPRQA
jgi:hypothetical protein